MKHLCKFASLIAFVAPLLAAGPTQTQTAEESRNIKTVAATASSPVAFVYLQTSKGVNAYSAAPNGKLTLVKGSPFKTTGAMGASNGSHFITVGTDLLHSYSVASNGAIGQQVSTINTQVYAGSECGNNTESQAVFDHTGRNLYLGLDYVSGCTAIQTYDVAKGSGKLSFVGASSYGNGPDSPGFTLTVTGNDAYGYAILDQPASLMSFKRQSDGAMELNSFQETDPTPAPGRKFWPLNMTAAPNNLVAIVCGGDNQAFGGPDGAQLASYAIDSKGNITSTNTWENMPYVTSACGSNYPELLQMSPSGKLLAVINYDYESGYEGPWGLSIFHFNGDKPLTPFGATLDPKEGFVNTYWDNDNHLYALSSTAMHVFTITPTSIAEAPGSPYQINNGEWWDGMVVIAK